MPVSAAGKNYFPSFFAAFGTVARKLAASTPMVGGVITSTISLLVVYPAIFYLWRSRKIKADGK